MPKYLLIHENDDFFTEEKLKELSKKEAPEEFEWKKTYCNFENNKFFCLWEAPSPEAIEQLFKKVNVPPCDAIYSVQTFNPKKSKLE